MIAALNDLKVSTTNVGNAYLNAECREKVWFQAGLEIPYYDLLLVYVDDVLLISKNPDEVMEQIGKTFRLKEGYGKPITYLGAETYQHVAEDGSIRWVLGSGKYVKNIVEQVKEMLEQDGRSFKVPNSERKQDNAVPTSPGLQT